MEKIIKIDGKDVPLKATAMNMVVYRSQFNKDIMEVAGQIVKAGSTQNFADIDSLGVARIIWTMAKTADKDLPPFEKWFEGIEMFPVLDILGDTMELIMANLTSITTIKPKNAKRAES
jgi:hypothetical protein